MRINIYDIDYINKSSNVNFLCMKIASYHKQIGDTVTLLKEPPEVRSKYDVCYVIKQEQSLDNPSLDILMDERSRVYGVEYFSNWKPDRLILACHPDYTLYPHKRNKFERADAWQFTDNEGHLLPLTQDPRNADHNKLNLILDENLWVLNTEDLEKVLSSVKYKKNLYFLKPISLKRVCCDKIIAEAFCDLKLTNSDKLKWTNDMPFTRENLKTALAFLNAFKDKHPGVSIGDIHFIPDMSDSIEGLNNMLYLMLESKRHNLQVNIDMVPSRMPETMRIFSRWSIPENYRCSFLEFIAARSCEVLHCDIQTFYAHPGWWTDIQFRAGVAFIQYYLKNGGKREDLLLEYYDHYFDASKINWTGVENLWY